MKRIGSGTYGTVYLIPSSEQEKANGWPDHVVLKVARHGELRHEMKVLLDLQEVPGAIKFRGYNEGRKSSNLLMDYGGPPLYKACDLSFQDKEEIMFQLIKFVDGMHSMGYIHGDLKPGNIVYDGKRKQLYVIDYGFAARLGGKKRRVIRSPLQTEEYRAPEVWAQDERSRLEVDEKVDMWSIGIIMTELYLGWTLLETLRPCKRSKMGRLEFAMQLREVMATIQKRKEEFQSFYDLLMHLLDKNPETRWSAHRALLWLKNEPFGS